VDTIDRAFLKHRVASLDDVTMLRIDSALRLNLGLGESEGYGPSRAARTSK
jgi:hypothetical protein